MGNFNNTEGFLMSNRADEALTMDIRAGKNSDQDALIRFYSYDNVLKFQMGRLANGSFVLEDAESGDDIISSVSLGNYSDLTTIKGPDGNTVQFQISDTLNDEQDALVKVRNYDGVSAGVTMFRGISSASFSTLYLGGSSGNSMDNVISYGGGNIRHWVHNNGVNVGINPGSPTSGRAFQVTTSAQANAMYFDDNDATCHFPWSSTSGSPNIAIGGGSELKLYQTGSESVILAATDGFRIDQSANADMVLRCSNASGGDFRVQTRGTTTKLIVGNSTVAIGGSMVFNIPGHSSAPSGTAGDIYYDTTTNKHYGYDGTSWNAFY